MPVSAADVKKLRDETDAPMMECKKALEEADGDFDKAKAILREKGKAAAAKRADRETKAGVALLALSPCGKKLGGAVLTCETDFVARNEDFLSVAQKLAETFAETDPGSDPLAVETGEGSVGSLIEGAVAKIRENIQLAKAVHFESTGTWSVYVHHNKLKAAAVALEGSSEAHQGIGHKIAIQCVAFPPQYLRREEVPQEMVERELEIETQRALNEGKKAEIAANIAKGRVNKEFFSRVVLLEQPFYEDAGITVGQFLKDHGNLNVERFVYLAVGE
ncbi:MAG: translation elongation factor Ts [Fimbriimonadales bacterium]|nr:translation elongation factor Ts [Fimbriimonadales bacterium]